ncbi:hypothetical protein H4219_001020 [Mycoemilia scoparia]|uniref:Uncharacterized protein n=1 Tax=Mycoemilia scoparia TaxID=417184 RepID=A0A9W8A1Q0_9FUNG|nr:hypothetical protein H4219_001020 [Mycoemilia scoparia]
MIVKSLIASACLMLSAFTSAVNADNTSSTDSSPSFIVFGNSLSDDGNAMTVLHSKAYWMGRYSNAPVWNEYVANILNMTLVNYAFGGATSSNSESLNATANGVTIPSYLDQISAYLKNTTSTNSGSKNNSQDLVGLEIGSNNFLGTLSHPQSLLSNTTGFVEQIVDDIVTGLNQMVDAGYRRFFIWNLPAIWLTPLVINNKLMSQAAKSIVQSANTKLNETIGGYLDQNKEKIDYLHVFDVAGLMQMTIDNEVSEAMNIHNFTAACFNTDKKTNEISICDKPYEYYFYDGVHPSARVQYLAGAIAANYISVPNYNATTQELIDTVKKYDIGNATATNNILADDGVVDIGSYQPNSNQSSLVSKDKDDKGSSKSKDSKDSESEGSAVAASEMNIMKSPIALMTIITATAAATSLFSF